MVVRFLVEEMVMRGHSCMVYYLDEDYGMDLMCCAERISFVSQIPWNSFSIVHSHGIRPNLYVLTHRPIFGRVKCVTTFHSYFFEEQRLDHGWLKGTFYSCLFLLSAIRHNKIVALSKDACFYYSRYYAKDRVTYVYDGLDFVEMGLCNSYAIQTESMERSEKCVVGTYCVPSPLKGLNVLSEAVGLLGNEYELLILYGREDVYKELYKFDIFVVSSYTEGFCLALLEAAAAKRRIVCSDIPGMREKYSDDEVTYFKPGDVKDLMRAIREAQKTDKRQKAFLKAMSFSAHNMGDGYERVYKEMAE